LDNTEVLRKIGQLQKEIKDDFLSSFGFKISELYS